MRALLLLFCLLSFAAAGQTIYSIDDAHSVVYEADDAHLVPYMAAPVQPVVDLDLLASSLPGSITFTRASVATDIISGVVTSFSSGQARISTTNGLLIEPARTNLVLNTSVTAANSTTLTAGQADPAGGTAAYLHTATAGTTGQQWNTGASTISYVNGTTYTVSVFLKAGTADRVQIFMTSTAVTNGYANYYLNGSGSVSATGAGAANAAIDSIGGGWYRAYFTFTATGGTTNTLAFTQLVTGSEGRAASTAGGSKTIVFYGAQVEAGAFLTSFIPTTSASVARAADVAYVDLASTLTESTWYVKGTAPNVVAAQANFTALEGYNTGAANNSDALRRPSTGSGNINGRVITSNVTQADMATGVVAQLATFKAALVAKDNDFSSVLNGGTVQTDAGGTAPTLNRVGIGMNSTSTNQWSGYLHAVKVWNYRQTDAYIQVLTQ